MVENTIENNKEVIGGLSTLSVDEMKNIFSGFDMRYVDIHMHYLKHLNRYHKYKFEIPTWLNNKWENHYILYVVEVNGKLDNRAFEKEMKLEENVLGDKEYKFVWELKDTVSNTYIRQGVSETRNSMFGFYAMLMRDTLNYRKQITGLDMVV